MASNLRKARNNQDRLMRILVQEVVSTRVLGTFLKAVVQAVILFGSET